MQLRRLPAYIVLLLVLSSSSRAVAQSDLESTNFQAFVAGGGLGSTVRSGDYERSTTWSDSDYLSNPHLWRHEVAWQQFLGVGFRIESILHRLLGLGGMMELDYTWLHDLNYSPHQPDASFDLFANLWTKLRGVFRSQSPVPIEAYLAAPVGLVIATPVMPFDEFNRKAWLGWNAGAVLGARFQFGRTTSLFCEVGWRTMQAFNSAPLNSIDPNPTARPDERMNILSHRLLVALGFSLGL